ncbi:MAG: sn-glycerol 3-phosphate transport system substrate-binding protein [Rhodocyclaceae bacterium]|nr:MAG: sn-glycerol 3-phosphate transport system substrate-binding protein [Rhodocyclaceae bacterium]TNC99213.1 MAG: sn-glycerol 3-phosphate transport system substrate-binding protein [Rhodocyclaceae bacterium]
MRRILWTLLGCGAAFSVFAQDISLRHDLDGKALDTLATLVLRFNDELKGKGRVLLQDSRGLENKHLPPHLALLDPDDSMEFFGTRPRFRPLHEVMREAGQKFDAAQFYPQVADAVDDASGRIQALPMGLALPVLFVNRAALSKAGVDPDQPGKTWWELQKTAGEIYDHGGKCPLTTTRFAWIHSENVSTQAGEAMVARVGSADKVLANSMVNVKHLALLASWQKSLYFHYSGPGREGNRRFLSGECAMLTGESSLYAEARRSGIDVGISALPYYDDVYSPKPADVLPDGGGLWVLAGHKKDEYKLAARFMTFLLRPEVQKEWVQATSYLPMTPAALAALRGSDIPQNLLDATQKRLSVSRKGSTRAKHGPIRDRLHEFLGEEVAFVWSAGRAAKEALDNTVRRVNEAIAPVALPAKAPAKAAGVSSRQ